MLNLLEHTICFARPRLLNPGSAWIEHTPFAMFIVDVFRPRVLVELGAYSGTSYCAFCQAVKDLALNTHCIAVDTWQGDEHAGFYGPELLAELRAHHDPLYGGFSRLLQSTFDAAVQEFDDGSIDLLHIDGLHTYEAVKHDFETWVPKLSDRALVLFHDTNEREADFGVWRLWKELEGQYPHLEFLHGHGLGVLRLGRDPTPDVEPLFSLSADRLAQTREFFSILGSRLSLAVEVAESNPTIRRLSSRLAEAEESRRALTVQLADLGHAHQATSLRLAQTEMAKAAISERLAEKEQAAILLATQLDDIHRSKAWRLILALRGIRLHLVPVGSGRERLIRRLLSLLRALRASYVTFRLAVARKLKVAAMMRKVSRQYRGPVNDDPTISIIIPVYNQFGHTLECLLSIARSHDQADHEVIVVDDASSDETASYLSRLRGIRHIRNAGNLGFLASCNIGAREGRGSYLVFLNNDTQVHPLWLDNLLETYTLIPKTGLVGSKLIFPDGRLQEAGGVIWADGSAKNHGCRDDPQAPPYNYVRETDYVSGASIMVPRMLWENLGGFDPQFEPAYYEDVDLAFRIRRAGYKVVYQPFSEVTHAEGTSSGVDLAAGVKRYQLINARKFLDAWHTTIATYGLPDKTPEYLERDRFAKARVLYIDDQTPQPDRHAGAVLSECYMTALRDDGYAVTFLPHFDSRYSEGYTRNLQKKGIECLYWPYLKSTVQYLRDHGRQYDFVVVSRLSVAREIIHEIREYAPQAIVVFSTIDLHFMRLERGAELSGSLDDLQTARQARREELDVIQRTDCTLVVSAAEAKLLSELAPNAMIRTVPFPADVVGPAGSTQDRKDVVYLGGFRHPPNVDAVLYFARQIWPLILEKVPGARFVIAGPDAPAEIDDLASESISVVGFVEDLQHLFATARVSVAPMRYGAGIKGKVLTSLGHGIPCVLSSIAAEGIGLTNDHDAIVRDPPMEFARAVAAIFADPALWESLSRNGLAFVRQNYSRPAVSQRLLDVFKELSRSRTPAQDPRMESV